MSSSSEGSEMNRAFVFGVAILCSLLVSCGEDQTSLSNNVGVVSRDLETNSLGIESSQLREIPNTNGQGVFVYSPQTSYQGVQRYVIWLVIEEIAFPLNGATKNITPSLPWPREAPEGVWERTGLDMFNASEAIEIVFD